MLWLRRWTGNADDLDDLVHETNHLIYDISRDKGFQRRVRDSGISARISLFGDTEDINRTSRQVQNGVKSKSKKRKTNGNKNS